ncbi:Uncharacterised protein [Bordetella pertussis]|nr:Uncharacterised protein [Bordetella pertussis]
MRIAASGKRWRSLRASATGSGSPQNRNVRSARSCCGEKSRLTSC